MYPRIDTTYVPRVAIVGGGASGVAVATHLAAALDPAFDLRVLVFEPGGTLGRGIAYSTTDDQHVLNVPAKGMSVYRDDMSHFQRWAGVQPDEFVSRARYGEYLQASLRAAWRKRSGRLRHVREQVVDVIPTEQGWCVVDGRGERHLVDAVVIATGHQAPVAPAGLDRDVVEARAFHVDPWSRAAMAGLRPREHVVCLGTGLTFVDVALSALSQQPGVTVTGLSRRGLLPSRHQRPLSVPLPPMPLPDRGNVALEHVIEHVLAAGPNWRGAVDGMRAQTPEIWQRLSEEDRVYFMRHVARDWDVIRHRMAPSVADTLDEHLRGERLRVEGSNAYTVRRLGDKFVVKTSTRAMLADCIVVCTGPRADVSHTALGRSLVKHGLARPGPFDIGYDIHPETGEMMGVYGTVTENLFAVGPLRRGVLFESTAMPEISAQAQELAALIAQRTIVASVA